MRNLTPPRIATSIPVNDVHLLPGEEFEVAFQAVDDDLRGTTRGRVIVTHSHAGQLQVWVSEGVEVEDLDAHPDEYDGPAETPTHRPPDYAAMQAEARLLK